MILNTETQSPEFLFSVKAMSRGHRVYCPSRMWRSRGFRGFPRHFSDRQLRNFVPLRLI